MAHVLLVNPSSPKRRRRGKKRGTTLRANPAPRRHRRRARRRAAFASLRRYRRNPSMLGGLGLAGQVMPVALGAGGALLTDMALDKLPIPIDWKLGNKRHLAKAGVGVGLGLAVGKFMGRDKGAKVMAGALTVVAYDWLKQMLARSVVSAPIPAPAAVNGMGMYPELEYMDNGDMGALLVNGEMGDMDYDDMGELVYS